MPQSVNQIVLAAAGSGKTTTATSLACRDACKRTALVTYTRNGRKAIEISAYEKFGSIPANVCVLTWYSFILTHFVRPYRNYLYNRRIENINFFDPPKSRRRFKKHQVPSYFFASPGTIWADRTTDFAHELIRVTKGLTIRRVEGIFERIIIDEAQDLAGWDLEIVEALLSSKIETTLIGDHRQATYSTNKSNKNIQFRGENIIKKMQRWETLGLVEIKTLSHSHRCVQTICDVADQLFPECSPTKSYNTLCTGHDGVYLVREKDAEQYFGMFSPQVLRWSKQKEIRFGYPMNFGDSKGMTFDRVLIYPHTKLRAFLKTGKNEMEGQSKTKSYVAITRARQSVALVVPDDFTSEFVIFYEFPH